MPPGWQRASPHRAPRDRAAPRARWQRPACPPDPPPCAASGRRRSPDRVRRPSDRSAGAPGCRGGEWHSGCWACRSLRAPARRRGCPAASSRRCGSACRRWRSAPAAEPAERHRACRAASGSRGGNHGPIPTRNAPRRSRTGIAVPCPAGHGNPAGWHVRARHRANRARPRGKHPASRASRHRRWSAWPRGCRWRARCAAGRASTRSAG